MKTRTTDISMGKTLITLLLALMASVSVWAQNGTCGKKLKWSFDTASGQLTITGSGDMADYAYNLDKGVSNAPWGKFADKIRTVSFPEGITSIGSDAFRGCTALASLALPATVTSIGYGAFQDCSALSTVSLSVGISSIRSYTFSGCSSLTAIVVPAGVTSIGYGAFEGCTALRTVTLPTALEGAVEFPAITQVTYQDVQVSTPAGGVAPDDSTQPPLLSMVEGSLQFVEPSGNNAIDAEEHCSVAFGIKNEGKGAARGCVVRMRTSGSAGGLSVNSQNLPVIEPGETQQITVPVVASHATEDGEVQLSIWVEEPNGFGTDPIRLTVPSRAFVPPYVQVVDYAAKSATGTISKKVPFTLQLMLQNTRAGEAKDVEVELVLPNDLLLISGGKQVSISRLEGGEVKPLEFELIANNNYADPTIPIRVKLRERYGTYAEDKNISLQMNQASSSISLSIAAKERPKQEIRIASFTSAVDKNIPVSTTTNDRTFAVVIANEEYDQVENVPFALNDGSIFAQYLEKTLGIPAQNIHLVTNATRNKIRYEVEWLCQIIRAYEGGARAIFYYAGHGVPDEASKTAFLLPVDGNGSDPGSGYKLDDLYQKLGSLNALSVTVFLDACFSGSKREDGMLASARGVAMKAKMGMPVGNMVVFSAATGDETAYPNNRENHGMFTYYLLKKLQETEGDVTYDELAGYIRTNVTQQSLVLNGKSQTPTVTASTTAADWQNWKMK